MSAVHLAFGSMILSFGDAETESIYHGESTRSARKRLLPELRKVAQRKLDQLDTDYH